MSNTRVTFCFEITRQRKRFKKYFSGFWLMLLRFDTENLKDSGPFLNHYPIILCLSIYSTIIPQFSFWHATWLLRLTYVGLLHQPFNIKLQFTCLFNVTFTQTLIRCVSGHLLFIFTICLILLPLQTYPPLLCLSFLFPYAHLSLRFNLTYSLLCPPHLFFHPPICSVTGALFAPFSFFSSSLLSPFCLFFSQLLNHTPPFLLFS